MFESPGWFITPPDSAQKNMNTLLCSILGGAIGVTIITPPVGRCCFVLIIVIVNQIAV